jgi:hypothetical protein
VDTPSATPVPPTLAPATLIAPPIEIQSSSVAALAAAALEAADAESLQKPNGASSTDASEKSTSKSVAESELAAKSTIAEAALGAAKAPIPPAPTVTLKSKAAQTTATQRRQKKTSASEDWFASHGKFIAVAFVIALIGTVYLARTNRQQATPVKEEAAVQSPLVDLRPTAPSQDIAPARVQTVAAVSDSKVELQPPSAPPLIASAPQEKSAGADKLFDFPAPPPSTKAVEHVAARPTSAPVSAPAGTKAEESPAPAAAAPSNTAPALTPAYPVTNSPAAYPSTTAGPGAYPQTSAPAFQAPANPQPNYGNQFPAQPNQQSTLQQPTPQQPAPQQSGGAGGWSPPTSMNGAGSYQSIDNTARGPRYERTGSGRY